MKIVPFAAVPAVVVANIALSLFGVIIPCKAMGDMTTTTVTYDGTEHKDKQDGQSDKQEQADLFIPSAPIKKSDKKKQRMIRRRLDLPPLTTIGKNPSQTLRLCEGDCDNNSHCSGNLKCFHRRRNEPVPGCSGSGTYKYDYCIDLDNIDDLETRPLIDFGTNPSTLPLQECEGDCDNDADCAGDLECFQRNDYEAVPGCYGSGRGPSYDYCYNPLVLTPSATPSLPPSIPTLSPSHHNDCNDSPLKILTDERRNSGRTCTFIAGRTEEYCHRNIIQSHCPSACGVCDTTNFGTSDSKGTFIFEGKERECTWLRDFVPPDTIDQVFYWCQMDAIRKTCRKTCGLFCAETFETSTAPSSTPSTMPSSSPSITPTFKTSTSPSSTPSILPSSSLSITPSKSPVFPLCSEKITSTINEKFGYDTKGPAQEQALTWLFNDTANDDCENDDVIIQRYVLAVLYYSTNGDGWTDNIGWLDNANECSWKGLTCNTEQKIKSLNLGKNNLDGTIPRELSALDNLEDLRLYLNSKLSGTLHETIGDLVKLSIFDLLDASLTGTIPDLSKLQNLSFFRVSDNDLTGPIADKFNGLTKLRSVSMDSNTFTGSIPDLSNNLDLNYISLAGNKLDGELSPGLFGLPNLQTLYLRYNDLTGSIPDNVVGSTSLRSVYLNSNSLTGSIPDFSNNLDLWNLSLGNNEFDGGLDPKLFELPNLEYLYLYGNELTGSIPDNFGGSTSLKFVYLRDNLLTGTIPDIYGNSLKNIVYLFLHRNKMSGPVPESICDLRSSQSNTFKGLKVDCAPANNAQNPCQSGCCTACEVGKGLP